MNFRHSFSFVDEN